MSKFNKNAKRANRPNPRAERNNVHKMNVIEHPAKNKKITIIPRNISQERYLELLEDESKSIVFATGPAGTGKTLLATLYAINQLKSGNIKKIILTRPAVSVDEQHGFLPGSLIEKMAPWVIPITDIFKEYYSVQALTQMLEEEVVEIAPLAYMRGRTLKNAIILCDESQNMTPNQMKMILTRLGENSRMFINGDTEQHDRGFIDNGLKDFLARLSRANSDIIASCKFGITEVERHEAVQEVLNIYGKDV